ncbi:MAG: PA14 domain-containing protein, partial [Bacteroidota bacterium]
SLPPGAQLIDRSDCKACHNEKVKTVGPSYVSIAKKYPNTEANTTMLMGKVKNGGSGNWGEAMMTAHPDLKDDDLRQMIGYIMNLDKEEEAAENAAITSPSSQQLEKLKATVVAADDLKRGLLMQLWQPDHSLAQLADVDYDSKPDYESIVEKLNFSEQDYGFVQENFAVQFTGYVYTPEADNVLLRLRSDDGSRLFIDGKEIITHDGLHGMSAKDGEIAVEEGLHHFKLQYFQGGGGRGLSLAFRSTEMKEFSTIPADAFLYHKEEHKTDESIARIPDAIQKKPGDRDALQQVHPSFDLAQARPDGLEPKVGGMDFLSDGRLVISCWDAAGSVYLIDGATSGDPEKMSYKLIAKGLAEP